MIVGIISDTHDNLPAVEAAVAALQDAGVGHLIHAGDFVAPFALPPLQALEVPVTAVLGNNDGERLGLSRRFADYGWELQPKFAYPVIAGCRFAIHHEPEPVEALAASGLYDVVVYGHTHAIDLRRAGRCWVINPGEVGGWLTGRRTVVVFDTSAREATLIGL